MTNKKLRGAIIALSVASAGVAGALFHEAFDNDAQLAKDLQSAQQSAEALQAEKLSLEEEISAVRAELQAEKDKEPVIKETVVEIEKEVPVASPELVEKLDRLEKAYERLTGESFDYEELVAEDYVISKGQELFEDRIEQLLRLDIDESARVLAYYSEEADVDMDARRVIDGRTQDVLIGEAEFVARVRIIDEDDSSVIREYRVEYSFDYESDGDEDEDIEVFRV